MQNLERRLAEQTSILEFANYCREQIEQIERAIEKLRAEKGTLKAVKITFEYQNYDDHGRLNKSEVTLCLEQTENTDVDHVLKPLRVLANEHKTRVFEEMNGYVQSYIKGLEASQLPPLVTP